MPTSDSQRGRSERGQSTALVLTMLFFLVLFVGVAANVGQAVNRRIALQITADAGAWTGASAMAAGLNAMAFWNRRMQELWTALSIVTVGFTVTPPCEVTDQIFWSYRVGRNVLGAFFNITNRGFARVPYSEALRVSRANVADLFPDELPQFDGDGSSFLESDLSPEVGIAPQRDLMDLLPSEQVDEGTYPHGLPALAPSTRRVNYSCVGLFPPGLQARTEELDVWFEKRDDAPSSFVWIVKAPAMQAVMFDDVFGPDTIPEMRAAAAARPVGGSILEGRSEYVVKMVPLARVSTGTILDAFFYRGSRELVH